MKQQFAATLGRTTWGLVRGSSGGAFFADYPTSWSVVVLADAANDPRNVALDLLAQAEHDESAQSILVTDDAAFAEAVGAAVEAELRDTKTYGFGNQDRGWI